MSKPYIPPPSPSDIIRERVWALVEYFATEFPKASIKIEVKYNSTNKYCVIHDKGLEEG